MSIVTFSDKLVHYEAIGRGSPLLFVHSWLGSWRYWWPTMQELSRGHRVFAIDLWGFGSSSRLEDAYSVTSYVAMLANTLDTLGIARPISLIGHGLGGSIAVEFSACHPDRVDRLITIALPVVGEDIHPQLDQIAPLEFVDRCLGLDRRYDELANELLKTDRSAVNQLTQELRKKDQRSFLLDGHPRSLHIYCDQDKVVRSGEDRWHDLTHNGSTPHSVKLTGCNHFPMLEQPAIFNRLLIDYCSPEAEIALVAPRDLWQRRTR